MTTSAAGPGPAERARTVLAHAPAAVLDVGPDLSPLADRAAGAPAAGTLHGALVSPIPGPDRRLDLVTVHVTVEFADDVRTAHELVLAAFPDRLRRFARNSNLLLARVAREIVETDLAAEVLAFGAEKDVRARRR